MCYDSAGEGPWWEGAKYAMQAELEWGDFFETKGMGEEGERKRETEIEKETCLPLQKKGGSGNGQSLSLEGIFCFCTRLLPECILPDDRDHHNV